MEPPAGAAPAAAHPGEHASSIVTLVLYDQGHALTLFNRFNLAAAEGSEHGMELTAAALAADLRLQSQAEMDVLYPALEALGAGGRRAVQAAWPRGEAVETGALELLTLRRERAWGALPQCAQRLRRAYEAHVAELRASALPMLAGRAELPELGRRWLAAQATAPLEPASQAAAEAEAAAMRAGYIPRA